jgi:hypothetical protein
MENNSNFRLNGLNPLGYLGVNPRTPVPFFSRAFDPTPTDYANFILGTIWLNTASEAIWMLVSKANNVSTWVMLSTGSSGTVIELTANSGGPVLPLSGNINVVGDTVGITITGNPGTHTLTASLVGGGQAAQSFPTDSGTALPIAGVLNVLGGTSGRDINTSGSGNTIHVDLKNAIILGDLTPIAAGSPAITMTTGDLVFSGDITNPATNQMIRWTSFDNIISFFDNNIFMGSSAGNTTLTVGSGIFNVGIGQQVLQELTIGASNCAFGNAALQSCTTGSGNCSYGYVAMQALTTGSSNTAIGDTALTSLLTGTSNIAIGKLAGSALTGSESDNLLLAHAGVTGTSGLIAVSADNNTFMHNWPGAAASNGRNVYVGEAAGNFNTGTTDVGNVAVGPSALSNITAGARANVGVGSHFVGFLTSGVANTGLGHEVGFNSAMGTGITTGQFNILIGYTAGSSYTSSESYNMIMGDIGGTVGESNTLRIGSFTGPLTKAFIQGIRGITTVNNNAIAVLIDSAGQLGTVSSSIKYKENVTDMGDISSSIMSLRPVAFNFKERPSSEIQVGLIAEEVNKVMPNLVAHDSEGEIFSVKYQDLPVLLLNELQKQSKIIADLQARIAILERN